MKIIKKGKKIKEQKKFKCKECGCKFIAEEGKYETEYDQRDHVFFCSIECPECKSYCITY